MGAFTEAAFVQAKNIEIFATDNFPGMIEILRSIGIRSGLTERLQTFVEDSMNLPFSDNTFDIRAMSFGISSNSDPVRAAGEIYCTLKSEGTAVVICLKESTLFKLRFNIQRLVNPVRPLESLPMLEKWREPETLKSTLAEAGLPSFEMEAFEVDLTGKTMSSLVKSCAENFRGMVGQQWSEQEREKIRCATEDLLTTQGEKYLSVDEADLKEIRWVTWIATATRYSCALQQLAYNWARSTANDRYRWLTLLYFEFAQSI